MSMFHQRLAMGSLAVKNSGAPQTLNSQNQGVRAANCPVVIAAKKSPSRSSNNSIIPERYASRCSCIISMIPSLIVPNITGVYSKIPRVISNEMNSRICSSIGLVPAPDYKPNHLPRLLTAILKEFLSLMIFRSSVTPSDSSIGIVLSVVWAQYYLPHPPILFSRVILNPLDHLLKSVLQILTK